MNTEAPVTAPPPEVAALADRPITVADKGFGPLAASRLRSGQPLTAARRALASKQPIA